MSTVIDCKPGENVFEAVERGISEGAFPTGSRVNLLGGTGSANPTCNNQVGSVRVRLGEVFAVQGPE